MKRTTILCQRVLLMVFLSLGALSAQAGDPPGLAQLMAAAKAGEVTVGIATFKGSAPPSAAQLSVLRGLGLQAQGLKRLPMAFVRGTRAQLAAAVRQRLAVDVYPDQRLTLLWTESNRAMGATALHDLGLTGKGMQVAVIDTGIDATHPDLAKRVVHNVKILGPEYANQPASAPPGSIVLAADEGPYSNTDAHSGHGTLVAGLIAADGTTGPSQLGVAPEADLIGYSTGEVVAIITAVAAMDHVLDHPEWGIDAVNNSWGGEFGQLFNPAFPINVATQALADAGIVVVFAYGNSGTGDSEMTHNGLAIAPWVIGVAASSLRGKRSGFSSNGLVVDNTAAVLPDADGHWHFKGDGLGLLHPSATIAGSDIVSSCSTGINYITTRNAAAGGTPCVPGQTGVASGTSLSSPQVAGLAALLRQARPELSGADLRRTLEATAKVSADQKPLWQVGYGLVDASAALALVRAPDFATRLDALHRAAEQRVRADRDWQVLAADYWVWPSPLVTVAGAPDTREFNVEIPAGADALKIAIAFPNINGENVGAYEVTVFDGDGQEVGRTALSAALFSATALIDLTAPNIKPGRYKLVATGSGIVADTVTTYLSTGRSVSLQAALLKAQTRVPPPGPVFVADGTLALAFTPDAARTTGVASPEGCEIEPGEPLGILTTPVTTGICHSGAFGYATSDANIIPLPPVFTSEPFAQQQVFAGRVSIVVNIADTQRQVTSPVLPGRIFFTLSEVTPDGFAYTLGGGESIVGVVDGRNEGSLELSPSTVSAGSRLRIALDYTGPTSSAGRLLFGGAQYGDSGITVTVGHFEKAGQGNGKPAGEAFGGGGGALGSAWLALMGLAAALHRRPRPHQLARANSSRARWLRQ